MRNATRQSISPSLPSSLDKEKLFYWRIKNDYPWYAENFLKIRNKRSQLVDLKLNEGQIMVEAIDKYCRDNGLMRRYIILKARQLGMSTWTESKIFHETANQPLTRSLIVAYEESASLNLFNMSKLYYEELPDLIRPIKKYNNGKILSFENPSNDEAEKKKNPGLRSNITIATAGSGEVARSATPTKIHISELAFFADAGKTLLGMLQGVPDERDTLVVFESTANGIGDYFHKAWVDAVNGESDFIPIFLPWFTDSNYVKEFSSSADRESYIDQVNFTHTDMGGKIVHTYEYELKEKFDLSYEQLYWRHWAIRNKCNGDEELFMQEYPSTPEEAFIATGRPKFSISSLRKYQTQTSPPLHRGYLKEVDGNIAFVEDAHGYVSIWEMPEKDVYYCIGGDVAEGLISGDYSAGICGRPDTMDITAIWHGHIDPDLFGVELVKLARFYNDAYLGVEANNHGHTALSAIKRMEYWNIYFQKTFDKIADTMTQKIGWTTSSRTKPFMIDKLAEFVRERWIGIKSDDIVAEMFTYVIDDKGATNAQLGCYDDYVMATAIWLQLALEGLGENYAPEVPIEKRSKLPAKEIIDELFECDDEDEISL